MRPDRFQDIKIRLRDTLTQRTFLPKILLRFIHRPRYVIITRLGTAVLATLVITMFIGGIAALKIPLYNFAVMLFAMMAVGRIAQLLYRPRLRVKRNLPERCAVGAQLIITAEIRNVAFSPVFDLGITETLRGLPFTLDANPQLIDCLPARESMSWKYRITPAKRGVYEMHGPHAYSAFPFAVSYQIQYYNAPQQVVVYPRFTQMTRIDLPTGRRHQPGGLQLVSHVGDSPEFLGNREYRPGDRLRDLHHAAWARVGFPVVREFREEYLTRIGLVVDTYVPQNLAEGKEDLESALSLAASIADCLSRQDYVIDIFAAGPDLYQFQAGRSLAYLDNILDILACIEYCQHNPFTTLAPAIAAELEQISTIILVLLDWDETRDQFIRDLEKHGVALKVIVIGDRAPTLDTTTVTTEGGRITRLTREAVAAGVDIL